MLRLLATDAVIPSFVFISLKYLVSVALCGNAEQWLPLRPSQFKCCPSADHSAGTSASLQQYFGHLLFLRFIARNAGGRSPLSGATSFTGHCLLIVPFSGASHANHT
jgi:hypothetical protein